MRRSLVLAIILTLTCSSICFANVVKQYYPNGKLYSTQVYYESGIPKGPYKIYWPSGKLKQMTLYQNGRPTVVHHWSPAGVRLD